MVDQKLHCVAINIESASFPSALRLVFELFTDIVPKTCENFISLAMGNKLSQHSKKPLTYTNSQFHRIVPGFMMQGGDLGDGTGGESIYGRTFEDEQAGLCLKHDSAGLLSMANAGPNTNGSQFFILFDKARHLDGKHVIFGRLIEGMDALRQIEKISTDSDDKPLQSLKITSLEVMPTLVASSVVLPSVSSTVVPRTIKELLGPGVSARVLAADMAEDGLPLSFGGRGSKANKNSGSPSEASANNTKIEEQMASLLREKKKAAELVRGVSSTIFGEIPQPEKEYPNVGGTSIPLDSSPSDPSSTSSSTTAANAKLFALRLRMNAGRVDNHKEVVLEHTRKVDPSAEKRQRRLLEETDVAIEKSDQGNADDSMKRSRKDAPTTETFLAETARDAERRSYKEIEKNKRITDSYGWNVNSDAAMIHAHEKRLAALPSSAGVAQDAETETALSRVLAPGASLVPSSASAFAPIGSAGIITSIVNSSAYNIDPARVDRVVAELEATDARRSKFHRRRTVDARQDSAFVSEQNRGFNRKIAKEMNEYSIEIKQSLERGTK